MDRQFLPNAAQLPLIRDAQRVSLGFEHWQEALARLDDEPTRAAAQSLADSAEGQGLLSSIFANSPFLSHCVVADIGFLLTLVRRGPDAAFEDTLGEVNGPLREESDRVRLMRGLRRARRRVALLTAIADFSDHWTLEQVTTALSDFMDAALATGICHLLRAAAQAGQITLKDPDNPLEDCGYSVLAMGKYGAKELNYSSDVDLIVLYDPARIDYTGRRGLQSDMVRLTLDLARLLDERTGDGYVCRTDFRLRPDPGATPLAISLGAAFSYYESQGQNWERAAMIKARAAAGDIALGRLFLDELRPFVWRKHLDFWAIQDIHSIKRQIHAHKGGSEIAIEGHNVKLGRGGIREVEFFVQTQQLIFGGKDPRLRAQQTIAGLEALVEVGRVDAKAADDMAAAYRFLRTVEHRLQMVEDQQTHKLPASAEGVAQLAAFLGYAEAAEFRAALTSHLRQVEDHYADLFEEAPSLSGPGNLVFTGGEPEPGTLATLDKLGFKDGPRVFEVVRAWHHGRYRATRSTRARELLTELLPSLLEELGKTREPDQGLLRFDSFLGGLPAGVQLFSLLYQNPTLLEMLAEIMGRAPALAEHLSRRPNLLEAVLYPDFLDPVPGLAELEAELSRRLAQARDLQDDLDLARIWTNDRRFQVGVQLLRHKVAIEESSRALSDIAEVAIRQLLPPVTRDLERLHGTIPGPGIAVLALGKLGAREMTLLSDLDLVFLYEVADGVLESDGRKPLAPSVYFGRLAQRLITALTALTGEGRLYEVDPRLRPSGSAGPIALSLSGFERYQREDAWTWEHMALTRARVVAGDPALAERIGSAIHEVLTRPRDPDKLVVEVAEMRRRIEKGFPARSLWDAKYIRGGLYDLDFIAQYLQLRTAPDQASVLCSATAESFARLAAAGAIDQDRADGLTHAVRLWQQVQNYLRLTVGREFDESEAPESLQVALARSAGLEDFLELKEQLTAAADLVSRCYEEVIDLPAGDAAARLAESSS
jgi:glutamate-ammonia-ligase adenylyltransferase